MRQPENEILNSFSIDKVFEIEINSETEYKYS